MELCPFSYKPGDEFQSELGSLTIKKFIGKGKSGYSYLAIIDDAQVVLKIMHDEPNPYYSFKGNKVQLEVDAFNKLNEVGIRIPFLIESNLSKNYIVKNFIDGETAAQKIASNEIYDEVIAQLFEMSKLLESHRLNIDFFPTNFIIDETQTLFYIDYEINPFQEEWSLHNWGIYYWANSIGFKKFLETDDAKFINADVNKGIPIKAPFEQVASSWIKQLS